MVLLKKGEKPREWCRLCSAFHVAKNCPILRAARERADEVCRWGEEWIRERRAQMSQGRPA
jgi:hypothetical protein